MPSFVSHSLLKENIVERRLYQEVLAARVLDKGNSLIVAPTALGKTIIAAMVSAFVLEKNPKAKVLFLAPTKPLAVQHQATFRKIMNLPEEKIELMTGTISPKEREELWNHASVVAATPQTIENDIITGKAELENVSLLIFDEAHRAIGDYAYVFIAQQYAKKNPQGLILALTASPGGHEEKIQDVCRNLFIKNIEIRSHGDEDVKPYEQETEIEWIKVDLPPEFVEIKSLFRVFMNEQVQFFRRIGYGRKFPAGFVRKRDLLDLQIQLRRDFVQKAKQHPELYQAVSRLAALLKVSHANTLLETQGIPALYQYFAELKEKMGTKEGPKALGIIWRDAGMQKAFEICRRLKLEGVLHPKTRKLEELLLGQLREKPESKIIVFNHYRASARHLTEHLNSMSGIKAQRFVGQASRGKDDGMSQKEQTRKIEEFGLGEFNVLVATSVGEEGLDIPSVDLVVFFEAVPSEIRSIQRRGRTGRHEAGKVAILLARGTSDESAYYAARSKERKMHETLNEIRGGMSSEKFKLEKQATLSEFAKAEGQVTIYVDHREAASGIVKILKRKECFIKPMQLETADFVLSDAVAVERKTVSDFLQSMIDGRLFGQLLKMKTNYEAPLMILEGGMKELFNARNIHRNAIWGAMSSIALDYKVPILFTSGPEETAELLVVIAKREQLGKARDIRLRVGRKNLPLQEMQRYVVESLPMVGPRMARELLRHFGSIRGIMNADQKDMMKIENLGEKKARAIKRLVRAKYSEAEGEEKIKKEKAQKGNEVENGGEGSEEEEIPEALEDEEIEEAEEREGEK